MPTRPLRDIGLPPERTPTSPLDWRWKGHMPGKLVCSLLRYPEQVRDVHLAKEVSHARNRLRRIVHTGGEIGRRHLRRAALDQLGGQLRDVLRLHADEFSDGGLR